MKKLFAITLVIGLILSLSIAASAAGPFYDGNIDDFVSGQDIESDGAGLKEAVAATGQALAPNREFVDGNPSTWNDETEGAHKLFDGFPSTKYGSAVAETSYRAAWKYAEAFIAGNILLCTANDSEGSPRRMDDGWTLSGSNDGTTWTVIYTGKGEDVDNLNYAWFTIAIPNNTTAYSYYQIESEFSYDSDGIQYAEAELTVVPAPEPEPEPVVEAAPVEAAPVEAAPVAPVQAVTAPKTSDNALAVMIFAVLSIGAVVTVSKKCVKSK